MTILQVQYPSLNPLKINKPCSFPDGHQDVIKNLRCQGYAPH